MFEQMSISPNQIDLEEEEEEEEGIRGTLKEKDRPTTRTLRRILFLFTRRSSWLRRASTLNEQSRRFCSTSSVFNEGRETQRSV